MTLLQRVLLEKLPDAPSDGKRCKGARLMIAYRLVEMGLARCVGAGDPLHGGKYFVRTAEGVARLAAPDEEPRR